MVGVIPLYMYVGRVPEAMLRSGKLCRVTAPTSKSVQTSSYDPVWRDGSGDSGFKSLLSLGIDRVNLCQL